jgi:hypothetical protein
MRPAHRTLTFEVVRDSALRYRHNLEWKTTDQSTYRKACRAGWLAEINNLHNVQKPEQATVNQTNS